jgi:TPR repeat protein
VQATEAEYQRAAALEKQQRYPQAIEIYRALAEQGHAKSALALAFIYLNGLHRGALADMFGVGKERDRAIGERYQLLAAQNGSSIAQ